MKQIITFAILFMASIFAIAQDESKWPELDESILDQAYYPSEVAYRNYLGSDERNIQPKLKIVYSRPKMKERKIFGGLLKFGEEWRFGANEATLITFYQPVEVGGTEIDPGTYSIFALINEKTWTFKLSSETNIWGNANRDMTKDVASATVNTIQIPNAREALTMTFQEIDDKLVNLVVEWEKTRVILPISLNPILMDDLDPSPMDVAHYPGNSAFSNYLEGDARNVKSRIQVFYSRPQIKGRTIFGDLLKMGTVWRIGANEATEIVFFEDVKIGDTSIKKGRYSMFAKINKTNWDIIFSKDYPIWGEANRDISKDVAVVNVPVTMESEVVEALSMIFEEQSPTLVNLVIGWEKTRATIPITLSK